MIRPLLLVSVIGCASPVVQAPALQPVSVRPTPVSIESRPSPRTLEVFLHEVADAACAAHVRCGDAAIVPVGVDTLLCHPEYMRRWRDRALHVVSSGRARVALETADARLGRLSTAPCRELVATWSGVERELDGIVQGTLAVGNPCEDAMECASSVCDGTCRRPVPDQATLQADVTEGARCGERRCGEGLRCVGGEDARCIRQLAPLEPCRDGERCLYGFECTRGICAPLPVVGEPCDASVGCLEGICEDSRCRRGTEGETCSDSRTLAVLSGNEACIDGLVCDLPHLRCVSEP